MIFFELARKSLEIATLTSRPIVEQVPPGSPDCTQAADESRSVTISDRGVYYES